MAVPAASRWKTTTSRISSTMFTVAATKIKYRGRFDSPIPLKIPQTALYPKMNG